MGKSTLDDKRIEVSQQAGEYPVTVFDRNV